MTRRERILTLFLVLLPFLIIGGYIFLMFWPPVSEAREITGLGFELVQLRCYNGLSDPPRSEGMLVVVYRIPEAAARRLASPEHDLRRYPMWAGRALDGYRRCRWSPLAEAPKPVRDFHGYGEPLTKGPQLDDVSSKEDALLLAKAALQGPHGFVGGWYETWQDSDCITNCDLYVLDLKNGLLINIFLLT